MLPHQRRDPKCHGFVLVFVRLNGRAAAMNSGHASVAQAESGDRVVDLQAGKNGPWIVESDAVGRVRDAARVEVVVEGECVVSGWSRQARHINMLYNETA